MEALNIAMPSDSIGSACFGPGMPAKVKTALMTLLLSTSDVPGTVGRETELRLTGTATTVSLARAVSSSHQTSRIPTAF